MAHRKHKIFRYLGKWFAICGSCPATVCFGPHWSAARDLLTLHVEEHRPLTTADA
jgi:hypothetical protein